MTDPAAYQMRTPPTWARDIGALRATADYLATRPGPSAAMATAQSVAEWAELDEVAVAAALQAWETASPPVFESYGVEGLVVSGLTERGRRLVELWPSPEAAVDELVAALTQASEGEADEAKKSKLRTAAVILSTIARDVAVNAVGQSLGTAM